MTRRNALLGLTAILMLIVLAGVAHAQAAPAGQAAPASNGTQQATLYAVLGLAIMQVSGWLKQYFDAQKERRACAEAEAEEAQAKAEEAKARAEAKATQAASFEPSQVKQLQAHEVMLGRHEVRITSLEGYSRENREDHGKIFDKLDGIKDDIKGLALDKKGS